MSEAHILHIVLDVSMFVDIRVLSDTKWESIQYIERVYTSGQFFVTHNFLAEFIFSLNIPLSTNYSALHVANIFNKGSFKKFNDAQERKFLIIFRPPPHSPLKGNWGIIENSTLLENYEGIFIIVPHSTYILYLFWQEKIKRCSWNISWKLICIRIQKWINNAWAWQKVRHPALIPPAPLWDEFPFLRIVELFECSLNDGAFSSQIRRTW